MQCRRGEDTRHAEEVRRSHIETRQDTLVAWADDFGRTPMRTNRGDKVMKFIGRDHHRQCFTLWMADGGVKPHEQGYHGVEDRVHIHGLQATVLHLLGFDHERLTYPFQGRDFRQTDMHGKVVEDILD